MTTTSIIEGAEPLSHVGTATTGLLALHGFTGNPSSMRGIAEALAADGLHVELPRLPGHGTTIEEMLDTGGPTGPRRSRRRTSASPARATRSSSPG